MDMVREMFVQAGADLIVKIILWVLGVSGVGFSLFKSWSADSKAEEARRLAGRNFERFKSDDATVKSFKNVINTIGNHLIKPPRDYSQEDDQKVELAVEQLESCEKFQSHLTDVVFERLWKRFTDELSQLRKIATDGKVQIANRQVKSARSKLTDVAWEIYTFLMDGEEIPAAKDRLKEVLSKNHTTTVFSAKRRQPEKSF